MTTLAITATAVRAEREEIEAELEQRYRFRRMLRATDRVLTWLEERNAADVVVLTAAERIQIRTALAELPAPARDRLRDSGSVLTTYDSVFDVQDRLFRWRDPLRRPDPEEALSAAAEREVRCLAEERQRALAVIRRGGRAGVHWSVLACGKRAATRDRLQRVIGQLVADGLVRAQPTRKSRGGRYFALGEEGSG